MVVDCTPHHTHCAITTLSHNLASLQLAASEWGGDVFAPRCELARVIKYFEAKERKGGLERRAGSLHPLPSSLSSSFTGSILATIPRAETRWSHFSQLML